MSSNLKIPPPGAHGGDGAAIAAALGLQPEDVLDLSLSLNPVAPDPTPVLARHLHRLARYPDTGPAVAALASAMGVERSRLLLTNGGSEAIGLVAAELGGWSPELEFSLLPRGQGGPRWRSNPNNPSGLLAPPDERADVWDEAFFPLSTGSWTRADEGAVVVGSLTKLLACPGLRIGYVLAEPELVDRCRKRQPEWSVNTLAACALGDLLESVDLPHWCSEIDRLRAELVRVLRSRGLRPRRSDANWVLVDAPDLRERLALKGVAVRDCTSFGLPGVVRIAVPPEAGLERLDVALSVSRPAGTKRSNLEVRRQMDTISFNEAVDAIRPVDAASASAAREHHDRLTKPRGSLGRIEDAGVKLCAISGSCPPPVPEPVTVAVFAGDHGVVTEGVTPWPQEVTAQMVANFCSGGAAINVLARHVGAQVIVVDVGVAGEVPDDSPGLLRRKVRRGTRNIARESAMTLDETVSALDVGAEIASRAVGDGSRLLVTGDMGIGNTTASAAVIASITGCSPAQVTGRGTGIDDAMLERKMRVVETALARVKPGAEPINVLCELGGLEIAALCGFIAAGAALRVPVVVDGVIAAAAAVVATKSAPEISGYLVAGHRSSEPGSEAALRYLGLDPVLDLDLRLGEGSGAVLAVPAIQAAAKILREMATFDSAGVTDKGGGGS